MRFLWYLLVTIMSIGLLGAMVAATVVVFVISTYSKDLPDYSQLANYQPPVVTRIYAGDGRLVAEYAQEKRVFVPIDQIPDIVKDSFIAAEDKNFYHHSGVDYEAIMRAGIEDLKNHGSGRRPKGASTITQQVAKNFFMGNELSYRRKIREAILAFRIEKSFSKDHILELYLNEIFLGESAYGVAAAALQYFDKPLDELTVEEAAFLATLPKAPNNYNPQKYPEAARARRDWVIGRLAEDGYITKAQSAAAQAKPLVVVDHKQDDTVYAPYFAEEVRREIEARYGKNVLYAGGLAVRTSLDPDLQKLAQTTLRDGLEAYDHRHGYRGPLGRISSGEGWAGRLVSYPAPVGMREDWKLALVLSVKSDSAKIGFADGGTGVITVDDLGWAESKTSGPIKSASQALRDGDVIIVAPAKDKDKKEKDIKNADGTVTPGKITPGQLNGKWSLRQMPAISGALIAMDPHTGRVLAVQGGWSFEQSNFDRATQAQRQPGSAFKPFVYLTALENGFTPASIVLDAPFVGSQGPGMPLWRPKNYHDDYLGPATLRTGIEKSRNLMTVRLANYIGMDKIAEMAQRFGVMDNMPKYLSYSLGAGDTTLLRLATGYAQFVNGGKKITPTFIDRIQDRMGKTIFSHDTRPCPDCGKLIEWNEQDVPQVPDTRKQIADPRNAYQMVSILEGVVQRGTGAEIGKALPGWPLAGKTGTTNDSKDTWFIGFSPNLVVGVFVGFDNPKTLGHHETGATAAVPIFKNFMKEALKDQPPTPFLVPPGIRHVLIDAHTGRRAFPGDTDTIWESFTEGTEPNGTNSIVLDDSGNIKTQAPLASAPNEDSDSSDMDSGDNDSAPAPSPVTGQPMDGASTGTGGLY
jgi:penicillin-binding protein 1A